MIAVTGATGYIGRAVVAELSRRGLAVAALTRCSSAPTTTAVQWRLIGQPLPSAVNFAGCDTVIHLAGRAHTTVADANGRDLFDLDNRELALATAKVAQAAGVRRFVFVSTLGVHGRGADVPLRADSPIDPELPYARSKWAAEQQLSAWCSTRGLALCIVRPPMVYGPRCPGNFPRLVRMVRSGVPLPFSALHAQRSFIYVANLASFLAECATQEATGTYLISDGSDWSVAHLVRAIGAELRRPVRSFPVPVALLRLAGKLIGKQREVDSLTLPMSVDSELARRDFGWRPRVTPQEALRLSVRDHAD
jgi:nucleoside-diphosphate-sugar epimerase